MLDDGLEVSAQRRQPLDFSAYGDPVETPAGTKRAQPKKPVLDFSDLADPVEPQPADRKPASRAKGLDFSAYGEPVGEATGMIEPGNIDLAKRPRVKNSDGSVSTLRSMSFNEDGKEVLIPTVFADGRIMSEQEAIGTYRKTRRHLGIFDSPQSATAFAEKLHRDQEAMMSGPPGGGSLTDYPIALGKGFVTGAKGMVAASLKGLAGVRADRPSFPPGQSPLDLAMRGDDAAFDQYLAGPQGPPQPVTSDLIYQAGQAIEDLGKDTLAPRPGFEPGKSWTHDIGSGFGSVAAGIATTMIPGIGPGLAGGMFVTSGMGEATDKAVQNKASPEQIAQAARFGSIAGATDVVDALLPMLGSTGKALGFIKRVGLAAVGGAVAEGGQEGLQQLIQNAIAKGVYKPDQDMFEDVPRSVAIGAIVGGATAGGVAAAGGHRTATDEQPRDVQTPIQIDAAQPAQPALPRVVSPAGASPIEQVFQGAPAELQREAPAASVPTQSDQSAEGAVMPSEEDTAPAEISAAERRTLRKRGYTAEMIDGMSRAEIEAELGEAADHGTEADEGLAEAPAAEPAKLDFSEHGTPVEGDGTRTSPAAVNGAHDVERAAARANTEPTDAQVEANNYAHGHVRLHGLNISIENPKGSTRSGTAPDGSAWSAQMPVHYGYIKRTTGRDGDHVDVFLGDDTASPHAFIIDQHDPATGKYDEAKVLLGFPDQAAAQRAYDGSFSDQSGPTRRQAVSPVSIDQLKDWLRSGDTTKPFAKLTAEPTGYGDPAAEAKRHFDTMRADGLSPAEMLSRADQTEAAWARDREAVAHLPTDERGDFVRAVAGEFRKLVAGTEQTPRKADAPDDTGHAQAPAPRSQPTVRAPRGGFKTANDSTYRVHRDGATTRRDDRREHPRSERTFYLTPEDAKRLPLPKGKFAILDHENGAITLAGTKPTGAWSVPPSARNVKTQDKPKVGLVPLEVRRRGQVGSSVAYSEAHFGEPIVELGETPPPDTEHRTTSDRASEREERDRSSEYQAIAGALSEVGVAPGSVDQADIATAVDLIKTEQVGVDTDQAASPFPVDASAATTNEDAPDASQFKIGNHLTPAAEQRRADIEAQLTTIIQDLVGPNVRVAFSDTIPLPNGTGGWGSFGKSAETAAGVYVPAESLIKLALNDPAYPGNPLPTAFHESFHAIEHKLLTSDESSLLDRETPRLRDYLNQHVDFAAPDGTRAASGWANEISGHEVRAIAFEHYAMLRASGRSMEGVHIGVRRLFEKLLVLLRRIANMVRRQGFRTTEDIFSAAYLGEMGKRTGQGEASEAGEQFSVASRATMDEVEGALPKDGTALTAEQVTAALGHDRVNATKRALRQLFEEGSIEREGTSASYRYRRLTEQASIHRRAARDGDVIPPPETIRGALVQNKSFKDRLSDAIDAALLPKSRALWDQQIDLARFQKAVEAMGREVPESLDTYLAATLYPGRAGERMKNAVKELWHPLFDAMAERNVSRQELSEYLYARHAPERNARIREIDPDNDAGSGMTDDTAAEIMARLAPRIEDFRALGTMVDDIVAHNRSVMLREGLESERTLATWSDAYRHYVPLKGFEERAEDEFEPQHKGAGFDVRRSESRPALGRSSVADDVLANLLDQTQRTVIRAEKNRVAKTFLRFAQANESPFWKVGLAEKRRRISPDTGMVEDYWAVASPDRDRVFAAKVGGKTYSIEIKHPGLLEALKTMGGERLNPFMRFVARLTREYSRFQTAKNPEFVFTNLVRDLQDAGFTVSAQMRDQFTKRYIANLLNMRALFGSVLGVTEKGESTSYRRWFEEWRDAGGKISHYGLKDLEQIRSEIDRELNQRLESTTKTVALLAPRAINPLNGSVVKFLEAVSDVTETTTRLAVYIAGRESGLTKAQAAAMSRNATVDFNRRGKYGNHINALYAFANANIQGNVRMLRTLRKSKIARRAALGIVAGMMATYWNMAMSPDDKEGKKKAYEKRPYWERERNIILYGPGSTTAAKIPLGYGLNVFWMMGEQLAMRTLGKVGTNEALGNVLGTMASAFNPLGSSGSFFDFGTWVRMYTPTVARPIPELWKNRNWMDRPIHPDEMPWTQGLPHSYKHKALTNEYATALAQFLNKKTGGNKFEPGMIDLYPDDMEYAWDFAVGGLGKFMNYSSQAIENYANGVETPVERQPFVRRFVASDNSPVVEQESYYTKRRDDQAKARRLRSAIRARTSGEDDGSADAVIERLAPELGARPSRNGRGISVPSEFVFRDADKQIKELRSQEDAARKDQSLSAADRKTKIDALRQQMREVMGQARGGAP